ncbi:MAG: NAD-dependent DNA ligase LigA [Chitinophagales bacterium]|nr:NAD-dependent DNA ligase LigA [Chitinophagales bacterium]
MYSKQQQQDLIHLSQKLLKVDAPPSHKNEAGDLVHELRNVISFHDWKYYVQNDPAVSDFEYDKLFKLLKKTEEQFPELLMFDSPTQRVAYGLTKEFPSVAHLVPMLSLDNSYDEADLIEFDRRVKDLAEVETVEYCVEPKFDGASIALIYENDKLIRGATRGDGAMGEEITNNVKVLRSLPLSAPFSKYGIKKAELRGEVIIQKEKFKRINEKRIEEGLSVFANPRNSASGALRMQDSKEVAGRGLEGFMYHLAYAVDANGKNVLRDSVTSHEQSLEILYTLGFKSPYEIKKVCKTINEVAQFCEHWQEKRDSFPYEIDGMVVKVNKYRLQELTGATSHHPRWAMAYKFKARQATTQLNAVIFSVGRTGAITPIAQVEPVYLAGVTISNISLFNEEILREKDVRIGDTVLIERAGDVIPYIVKSIPEARNGNEKIVHFPKECPSCNSTLVKTEGEAIIRCVNVNCPVQVAGRIIHFVSGDAMDIRGLGESIVSKFFEEGLLKTIPDIYRLDFEKIKTLEGFGEKSAVKLQSAIEASKTQPIHRVIFGLGIRYVGETTAKTLAKNINHILDLKEKTLEQLQEMEDIGPKVAGGILEFFQNQDNIHLLQELEKFGVNMTADKTSSVKSDKLQGQTFLFTGTLEKFSRNEAEEMVEANGGKNVGSVSSKLNYLVAGASAGSKLEKAKKIASIKILTEEEFLELVK